VWQEEGNTETLLYVNTSNYFLLCNGKTVNLQHSVKLRMEVISEALVKEAAEHNLLKAGPMKA